MNMSKKERISIESELVRDLAIRAGILKGGITFLDEDIKVELDTEIESPTKSDYEQLLKLLDEILKNLTNNKMTEYKKYISKEIIDACYEQDENNPSEQDYQSLYEDLSVKKIYVSLDAFVLTLRAKKTFKSSDIIFQVNLPEYEIDDCYIDM